MSSRLPVIFVMALVITLPGRVRAQIVNVQSLLMKEAQPGLTVSFSVNGDVRRGNVDYLKAGGGVVSYLRRGRHRLIMTGRMDYASKDEASFIRETFEHVRWRWWLWDRAGVELFVQHGYRPLSRIAMRALAGAGVPFTMVRTGRWFFSGGVDLMLERDVYSTDDRYGDSGQVHDYTRLDAFMTLAWTPGRVRSVVTAYIQPVLTDLANVRVLVDGSAMVPVAKRVSLALTASYSRDTVSPEGTAPYDFRLVWSITGTLGPFFRK